MWNRRQVFFNGNDPRPQEGSFENISHIRKTFDSPGRVLIAVIEILSA
jgi:hypothetical protein